MQKQNVIIYIDKIDAAYTEGKLKGWSRLSDEWSEFSAPFNRAIRKLIKDDVPESPLLQMILPYWFNRSEMLEIHCECSTGCKPVAFKDQAKPVLNPASPGSKY